jgi:hypothetical protein
MVIEKKAPLKGGRNLDDSDLFPQGSLAPPGMVLLYQQASEGLSVLMTANWARLRWEGWMKEPTGRHGHPLGGVKEPMVNEKRQKYGQIPFSEESHVCGEPMNREQPAWDTNPGTLTGRSVCV